MRSAIVGCGAISRLHAAAIKDAGAQLAAVCDIIPERAEALADGAAVYTDLDKMLDAEKPDFLHVCTPHYLHLEMAEKALERGISVVLEKPPAMTKAQFERLLSLKKQYGGRVCVCFQNRLNAATLEAKRLVESGEYGALKSMNGVVTWDRRGEYYTASGWRGSYEKEGGSVLINQALHTLDLITYFLGAPTEVRSLISNFSHDEIETEDTVCAEMRFGDRSALLYATTCCSASPAAEITFFFDKAALTVSADGTVLKQKHKAPVVTDARVQTSGKAVWGGSHSELVSRFYAGEDINTLESCENTMRLLFAIYDGGLKNAERTVF